MKVGILTLTIEDTDIVHLFNTMSEQFLMTIVPAHDSGNAQIYIARSVMDRIVNAYLSLKPKT